MKTRRLFFLHLMLPLIPPSRCYGLKRLLLRWCGARVGNNVRILSTARFHLEGSLTVGDNSYIGDYVLLAGGNAPITIGANVNIGPRCTLVNGTHETYTEPDIAAGTGYSLPIAINDGVWLGAGVTVLGGITIGAGALVGAGSLVKNDVNAKGRIGGVPAKPLPPKPNAS